MVADTLLVLGSIVGAITLMALGGNDVANSQATAVGSGALSLKGAYVVAGLCEFLGSALMGSNVSSTLGDDFIDREKISDNEYCWGMFCSLISTAIWIFICTALHMPVSTTHSIIGALIGFELVATNFHAEYLNFDIIYQVILAWVASPLMGLILSYLFMLILAQFWLDVNAKLRTLSMPLLSQNENNEEISTENANAIEMANQNTAGSNGSNGNNGNNVNDADTKLGANIDDNGGIVDDILVVDKPKAKKFGLLFGFVMTVIMLFIFVGGPPEVRITELVEWWVIVIIALGIFVVGTILGYYLEKPYHRYYYSRNHSFMTEDYFILFLIIASGAVSFAHGGNDVANVIGPFGAIYTMNRYGNLNHSFDVPIWLSMAAGLFIVIGFILFGRAVMDTIGNKITTLTYRSGFAAQFAAALTVLLCNVLGVPVSSTTVIVGAVAGVGIYSKESPSERKDTLAEAKGMPKQSIVETTAKNFTYFWEKLKKMNFKILGKILLTWIVTIPSNALLCGAIFKIYKLF